MILLNINWLRVHETGKNAEHLTLNQRVHGSSPCAPTTRIPSNWEPRLLARKVAEYCHFPAYIRPERPNGDGAGGPFRPLGQIVSVGDFRGPFFGPVMVCPCDATGVKAEEAGSFYLRFGIGRRKMEQSSLFDKWRIWRRNSLDIPGG